MECILNSRKEDGDAVDFEVKWMDFDGPKGQSWEPLENVSGAARRVREFFKQYPEALGKKEALLYLRGK